MRLRQLLLLGPAQVIYAERLVHEFLANAGNALEHFRYYAHREVAAALQRHLATFVGYEDHKVIAYGHLDQADLPPEVAWLGIAVAEQYQRRGIGEQIIKALLVAADEARLERVWLAVEPSNRAAVRLYTKVGFTVVGNMYSGHDIPHHYQLMERKRPEVLMADSVGSLIDKLFTVDMKLWHNQELLYEIRRMTSFEEFRARYTTDSGALALWEMLRRTCDLNVQRSELRTEIDQRIVGMIKDGVAGAELDDGINVQRQHKTY